MNPLVVAVALLFGLSGHCRSFSVVRIPERAMRMFASQQHHHHHHHHQRHRHRQHLLLHQSVSDVGDERERMLEFLEGLDPIKASDELLDYSIDSFLRGDYDRPFAEEAPAPLPTLSAMGTVDAALRALREVDEPEPDHGAAVLLRFCAPIGRGDRWGGAPGDAWKEVLRGALTPTMLTRRIRSSRDFCGLLDWKTLDVTEGSRQNDPMELPPSMAFVQAALYLHDDNEETGPSTIIELKLRRLNGVWMIDSAQKLDIEASVTSTQDTSSK